MFGPASGVMFELWRIISNQKLANAWLVLPYIGLGWFIIILSWTYFGETSSMLQSSRQRRFNIQLEKKNIWQQKEQNALLQLTQKMELERKRSRLRSFVSTIVLKICFSCFHCFTICYLSWATLCDVAFSDYYKSFLFHVGSSAFEISTKLAVIVASCSVVAQ